MESTSSILGLLIFGLSFSISAMIVESQELPLALSTTSRTASHQSAFRPPPSSATPGPKSSPPRRKTPPPSLHNPRKVPSGQQAKNKPINPSNYRRRDQPTGHRMNAGQKIGLLFAGIAITMQICVIGFLVFKRRQLLMTKDRYEIGT